MELSEILLLAAAKALAGRIATKSVDGLWGCFQEVVREQRVTLTQAQVTTAQDLIHGDENFWNWIRGQAKFADRRGIVCIGPSGAGKTHIVSHVTGKRPKHTSTVAANLSFVQMGTRMVAVRDTVGAEAHWDFFRQSIDQLKSGQIVVVVVANGFLHTEGAGAYERPGLARKPRGLTSYLKHCRNEEVEWVKQAVDTIEGARKKVDAKALFLLANKRELWDGEDVRTRYGVNHVSGVKIIGAPVGPERLDTFGAQWQRLREVLGLGDKAFYYVEAIANYDNFQHGGHPASKNFSTADERLSMAALRAALYHEYMAS